MIGTFVNAGTILAGSVAGSLIKKGLKEKYQNILYDAMGLAATGLGLHAVVKNLSDSMYPVLFIISLSLGGIIGTAIDIDSRFQKLVQRYSKTNLGQGLSTAILLFCIGTLSILGPIESALNHNNTYLFTNATLDLVTSLVLASSYGIGIAISALILFVWQGSIYLLAHQVSPFLTPEFMTEISIVGGFLILASGLSILKIKTFQTLNLLPALLVPVVWFLILNIRL
ncbi:membrane protein [Lacrimispora xylanolytica]